MNCEQVVEAVSARVDGELGHAETLELAGHLGDCPDCAREAALLEETAAEMATLLQVRASELPMPEGLDQRITGRPGRADGFRMAPAAAIAAAVLLAFGVFLFLPPRESGEENPVTSEKPEVVEVVEAVIQLEDSISELSTEWDEIKQDLHEALLRVREHGIEVDLPAFLTES